MPTGTCRWCGLDAKLIEAHIVPRAFIKEVKNDEKHAIILAPGRRKFRQTTQSGVFDPEIMCGPCDNKLGLLDKYGYELFGKPPGEYKKYYHGLNHIGYYMPEFNLSKIKKFVLSVLFRASVSTRYEYGAVNLGPYVDVIREIIDSDREIDDGEFDLIVIWYSGQKYERILYPPYDFRINDEENRGTRLWVLNLPHYKLLIKMDKRPLKGALKRTSISSTKPQICVVMPFQSSSEERFLSELVVEARRRESSNPQ